MVEGSMVAGPHVRAACARHLRDLKEGPDRGLRWDVVAADKIIRYFRMVLRLNGGEHEGKSFILQPWQCFIVGSLFGWKGPDGFRRFRTAYIEAGKGCGKSPLGAGLGLYMMTSDDEARAESYAAAAKKDQAMIAFRDAVAMVDQSPRLNALLIRSGVNPVWNLAYAPLGSFFKPIASDDSQSGPRPHFALIDEYHEHKTDTMWGMMEAGARKGRRQALIFGITNSGFDRNSPCWQRHDYAVKVSAGVLEDDSLFAYVCALDEGDDPLTDPDDEALGHPKCWLKTNPSLGVINKIRDLRDQVRMARGMPASESLVRRLNFCEWVDAESPWISGDKWRACEAAGVEHMDSPTAVLALDLASVLDLVAAARVVKDANGHFHAQLRFWTPKDTIGERERKDRAPYGLWVKQGHLIAVPGNTIDYAFVVRDLMDWLGSSQALAYDQWKMDDFQKALDQAGVESWIWDPPQKITGTGLCLMRHAQGYMGGKVELDEQGKPRPRKSLWMPQSIAVLETAVMQETLHVEKNPVLTWNSASAVLERDATGNGKWEKRKSTGRIDGIVALSMAVGCADQRPKKQKYSLAFL